MPVYDSNGNEVVQAQTLQETDKKCPMCGGVMSFDPSVNGLFCPYCEYRQSIESDEIALEQDFYEAEATDNCDWGVETKLVICKSCGAESVYDALQTSGICPYCGSNQVMEAKGENTLAPNGVCPFKISAKTAEENFSRWIGKKLFAPNKAKKSAKAESFTGLYLPYWTFDTDTHTDYTGRYGKDRTVRDSRGNVHTVTDWYRTSGSYNRFIDDELVVATDRHEENILRTIEPFNTGESVKYKPEYIAGFVSERYTRGLADGWTVAEKQIKSKLSNEIRRKIMSDNFADHAEIQTMSTKYSNKKYKYLMLPIWLSSFKYKDKIYRFDVNGQTGKVGGKTPVSPVKVSVAVIIGLIVLYFLFRLFMAYGG